jgi:hypothetical protein
MERMAQHHHLVLYLWLDMVAVVLPVIPQQMQVVLEPMLMAEDMLVGQAQINTLVVLLVLMVVLVVEHSAAAVVVPMVQVETLALLTLMMLTVMVVQVFTDLALVALVVLPLDMQMVGQPSLTLAVVVMALTAVLQHLRVAMVVQDIATSLGRLN